MKNLFLLIFFVLAGTFSANAQACNKSKKKCCADKAKTSTTAVTSATKVASATMSADIEAADALAEADENIMKRVDAETGTASYFMKTTCEKSGANSWCEVKYCGESKKFTKVASASMERTADEAPTTAVKKACSKDKKACKKTCDKKKKAN